jgi:cellulose synthase/poly-beta-1,6-N-acetylglucosamine synthase-like glycosyltransferase
MAFALMHELRGRAKLRLNLSCGLWGNGMAFQRGVLEQVPWGAFSSVEDAEQHLRLVLRGIKVRFVPQVSVYGHMPDTLGSAGAQQTRWEAGRLLLLRRYWRRLAHATLRGNGSAFVALIELLIPPLSVVLIGQATLTALALALLPLNLSLIAVIALAILLVYISAAAPLARLQPRSYLALLQAPRFMLWKLQLYCRALVRRSEPPWTRTSREAERR